MNHTKEKTSILFVIDGLAFGGGERVFSQIINGLPGGKYEIFLTSQPNEQFYKAINNNRVHFLSLDFSKRINFSLIIQLSKIIKKNKIEIVHGQGARAEFYARLAKVLAGNAKYVSTTAMPVEGFDIGLPRRKVYLLFDRFSERFVDQFIVVSDVLRNTMIYEHEVPPEKVVKIYNGIEVGHYSPDKEDSRYRHKIREEFKIDKDTLLIGAIGRLVWQKGFEYLIKCIPKIIKTFPNVRVLIVGEGQLRDRLEALGAKLEVKDNLVFTGFRSDIKEILSAIDILAIPSLLEGFPMVTLEAMAMAKPVIATKIDGITEQIIDGESGILIPPKDSGALSSTITNLLKNKEFAKNLGLNARKRVEKEFSIEKMVAETEKVYQSLF